jgi:hypothetical protein
MSILIHTGWHLGKKGDDNAYTLYGCGRLFSSSDYRQCLTCMGKMGMRG